MEQKRLQQAGAIGGVLFVVLQLVSQSLIQVGGSEPSFSAQAAEIVDFFEARNEALFNIGGYLSLLSFIPLLGFIASLRAAMRVEGHEAGWLTFVATGAGLLFLALLAGGGFWHHAVFRLDGLDPQISRLLFDLGNFNFANMWVVMGTLVLAVGLSAIWQGTFPKWLGWSGVVVGIGLILARIFWTEMIAFTPYVLFWVWLIAVCVVIFRRANVEPTTQPS